MDAQHAGKENKYKLEKGGVKYTLLPLTDKPPKTQKVEGKSFLTITQSEKEVIEDLKESRVIHALVVKNAREDVYREEVPETV